MAVVHAARGSFYQKSNGIMLVVDIARGCFYQKCFDAECRARGGRAFELRVERFEVLGG
ncbi:hypothetical protein T484DRAFT_1768979 [Baffinella frigidus]|nr:hypothetical protein T484DRAFT_1768979 [Cryptophyta sp. CCMP2293]